MKLFERGQVVRWPVEPYFSPLRKLKVTHHYGTVIDMEGLEVRCNIHNVDGQKTGAVVRVSSSKVELVNG